MKSCKVKIFIVVWKKLLKIGVKIVQLREKIFLQKISMKSLESIRKFVKTMKYYSL